jgi:nitrate reductase gamma subunit
MSTQAWIEFAKGPLFTATFLIMVLGLARHAVIQVYQLITRKGRRLIDAPWNVILRDALGWAVPVKHIIKGTILFSSTSYLFHISVILVSLFLADHIALWEGFFETDLPAIAPRLADGLTLFTIACVMVLLAFRVIGRRQRAMSHGVDYTVLVLILVVVTTGFMASHPSTNPFRWETAMLMHMLSAELLFVMVPFTKLAHIVLFAFDRMSALHWQLRPGAGDRVAEALFGEEARV